MTTSGKENEVVIRAREITRRFGSLTAVNRFNLEVSRGEIFGLVGPDGAGKTATLRMLCGLMNPTEGQVWIAGHDVAREAEAVKDRIGYMSQRFGLYVDLTVEENMLFYADLFGVREAERVALMARLLRMTRMEQFRQRRAAQLSGGMKQKLALMCALLHCPQILFLDEPTNGVDPVSRRDFWAILYQLARDGMTVFVTTAYLDEAERCNRVGLMHRGRLIRLDTPESLKSGLEEICYEARCEDQRATREFLRGREGVLSVEPSGATLHLFLSPARTSVGRLRRELGERGLGSAVFKQITPSLEDAFIALIRKDEADKSKTI
jgi:ABC-2 type transport system ATP-binding protein